MADIKKKNPYMPFVHIVIGCIIAVLFTKIPAGNSGITPLGLALVGTFLVTKAMHETLLKYNVSISVMEPVKGGALMNLPQEALDKLAEMDKDASPASWAIRFAASQKNVMIVLSGMSSLEQVNDNTAFMKEFKPLTDSEMKTVLGLNEIIARNYKIKCTACNYCTVNCPQNIAIPDYFELYNKREQFGAKMGYTSKYRKIAEAKGKASDCIECLQCESKCPQSLPITNYLKQVADAFEK